MGLDKVNAGKKVPHDINVIIEIPAHGEPIKYEVDKETNSLFVDRFFSTAMVYPCNYGYIPRTLSQDGDPVDVLVVTPIPVNRGCVIRCRPIGALNMEDEAGDDTKILAVPISTVTSLYKEVENASDLSMVLLNKIFHFFSHYKDLEEGKWTKVIGWKDKHAAEKEILESLQRYEKEGKMNT